MAAEPPAPPGGDVGDGTCAVCWAAKASTVLTACGHSVLCSGCLRRIMTGPMAPKCPMCSTPIPPRAWKQAGRASSSAADVRSFRPESVEPLRAAEAAALRAGRSAFPTGVAGFVDLVLTQRYEPGQENMLLRLAARTDGALAAAAALLERGASVDAADARGRTPLICAAAANAADTVVLLLQRGASAYAVDRRCRTPLHCAALASATESALWLITAGAPLECRDAAGATPLMLAASSPRDDPECIRVLLESGADVGAKDARGCTALHLAARADARQLVEMLVWHGAAKNARARNGKRPTDCTKSLETRRVLARASRGPHQVVMRRPSQLLAGLVAAAFGAMVGVFLRNLCDSLRRQRLMQLMWQRSLKAALPGAGPQFLEQMKAMPVNGLELVYIQAEGDQEAPRLVAANVELRRRLSDAERARLRAQIYAAFARRAE